jgi:hypothetical protein
LVTISLEEIDLAAACQDSAGFSLAAGLVIHVNVERNFDQEWPPCACWRSLKSQTRKHEDGK